MGTKITPQFNYENRIVLEDAIPLSGPLVVYVEPSSYCNLECRFCPQHTGKGEFPKHNMSVQAFQKTLDDIAKFANKPSLMRFCGIGDPLFNKNISDLVYMASLANVVDRTELITNGLLLNDKLIQKFANHLGRIVISIEGLNEADYFNFALRKVDFSAFIGNITKFYQYADRTCTIHIKIHNQAVLTEERKKLFFDTFGPICDEIYIENLVDLWPERSSNLGLNAGHRFESTKAKESKVCPQIFKSLQVNADGRVLPCCVDWKSINVVGNIEENSLQEIWSGKPLRDLQRKHLLGLRRTFSPCKGCNHNEYSEKDHLDSYADVITKRIFADSV
jgi:radical SAM protein with 4Fe4S-binding SPASM domain